MEGPGFHIRVEIWQVRIVSHGFISRSPTQPCAQPFGQGCFASADVPGNEYKSFDHQDFLKKNKG
jgi:hypothetical protein